MAKTTRTNRKTSSGIQVSIADIDRQIMELMIQRAMLLAQERQEIRPARIAEAQAQIAQLVAKHSIRGPLTREALQELMKHLAAKCFDTVEPLRISYLGPQYSYSHLAATSYFGDSSGLVPVSTIAAVFESIVRHDCIGGVVPIENSTDGRVVDTLGMFLKHRVRIQGELLLPIKHNLLSRTARSEIKEIYSKPQALSQCRDWLLNNMPEVNLVEMSSTAAAAQLAAEKEGAAAIASTHAATAYGLEIIAASIQDNKNNITRFAILGTEPTQPTGRDKTAILFQVDHKPGALADVMMLFKKADLNLTWIESFPLPGSHSEYLFFVELEGHEMDSQVAATVNALTKRARRLEVLGSYQRHTLTKS